MSVTVQRIRHVCGESKLSRVCACTLNLKHENSHMRHGARGEGQGAAVAPRCSRIGPYKDFLLSRGKF